MGEAKSATALSTVPSVSNPIFYVLDTNVLIHDPAAIRNFDEHHVVIPITVLEELDLTCLISSCHSKLDYSPGFHS